MKLSKQIAHIEAMGVHGICSVHMSSDGVIRLVMIDCEVYDKQFPDASETVLDGNTVKDFRSGNCQFSAVFLAKEK
jgi:hypothetical protein